MIKKLARWILRKDLKLADEYATYQVKKIVFEYESKILDLMKRHRKELEQFIGSRK